MVVQGFSGKWEGWNHSRWSNQIRKDIVYVAKLCSVGNDYV